MLTSKPIGLWECAMYSFICVCVCCACCVYACECEISGNKVKIFQWSVLKRWKRNKSPSHQLGKHFKLERRKKHIFFWGAESSNQLNIVGEKMVRWKKRNFFFNILTFLLALKKFSSRELDQVLVLSKWSKVKLLKSFV